MRTADDLLSIPIRELESAARRARSISELELAARRAAEHLRSLQQRDGHWCGELEGNTILESEYLLLLHYLGRFGSERVQKAAEYIRRDQGGHGGWSIFPEGPPDVSTSIKAYFALKLCGDREDDPHMVRARRCILEQGGIEASNSFTKIYLSIFGQYEWERCPAIPPEMILLPDWSPFNIYEMSSWSRVMVVPLSVIWARRPVHPVPAAHGIQELYTGKAPRSHGGSIEERLWRRIFQAVDRGLWKLERVPHERLRRTALLRAERWIVERMERSAGIGAIFPPIVNSIYALSCLGYAHTHPLIESQLYELEKLSIEEGRTLRMQPCTGAVWDTALSLVSLMELDGGAGEEERRGVRWLLDREVGVAGDWKKKCPEAPISGWPFQALNELNPDCDDTAQVLLALSRIEPESLEEEERIARTKERAVDWLIAMQNDDGGWGAFDKGCDRRALTFVPFADHNAMIDPSTEDITGRVLDALARAGVPRHHPAIVKAVRFLESKQERDGSWYGRWGCNYIYGTYLALTGLKAVGERMDRPRMQRAAHWLRSIQNEDGGWGESFLSYDDPVLHKGSGESTAAQTAWALLALFATGDHESRAVRRGIDYLLHTQDESGGWRDGPWTGTGFPKVFYLRYDYYDDYFPLLALAVHLRHQEERGAGR